MDNTLFPGSGAFLDTMPQVCTLCGMLFTNTLELQRHMQLHILSNSNLTMMGKFNQPPPDPGIANFLMGGVSSAGNAPLLPGQSMFSGPTPSTLPHHLVPPGLMATGLPQSLSQPLPVIHSMKDKSSRAQSSSSSKPSQVSGMAGMQGPDKVSATPAHVGNRLASSSGKSRASRDVREARDSQDSRDSVYISTFPKDLNISPPLPKVPLVSQQEQQEAGMGNSKDSMVYSAATSQFDPLEALLLPSPTKLHIPPPCSTPEQQRQLFQPFSDKDTSVNVLQIPKSYAPSFTAENLVSPVKSGSSKHPDFDILSTPQKIYPTPSSDSLFTLAQSTSSGDLRHFALNQDTLDNQSFKSTVIDDAGSLKSQMYPGVIDTMNISPKAGQVLHKKDSKHPKVSPMSMDLSRSSSPDLKSRSNSSTRVSSPKCSSTLPTGLLESDMATLPTKSQPYVSPSDMPTVSYQAAVPKPFGGAQTTASSSSSAIPDPAIDIAVNPLGTGYFNALTSKLIDPTFSINSDYNKPSSSGVNTSDDGSKSKSYFENGILINQDYDKISDTDEQDDLERLIETIDSKSDNNDTSKGFNDIEELLSEFNDKHPEVMKQKAAEPAVDDFLSEMLGEKTQQQKAPVSESVTGPSVSKSDDVYAPAPDPFEHNQDAISELLAMEMEIIDKESKEVELSRLSAVSTACSTTLTTSDPLTDMSVSSVTTSTISTTTLTSAVTLSTTSSTPVVSTPVVTSLESKTTALPTGADSDKKPDEDVVDFDIPKVGKLMKIRKYQEIKKQKEQTADKDTEVKVYEKKDPVVEEKPQLQTILVQVSKRKKIEYGPYINRQSLLEGKPKQMEITNTPTKTFRPKPKPPQQPQTRTFNLRERRSRPDFATLAGTTPRNGENKKGEDKAKSGEKAAKTSKDEAEGATAAGGDETVTNDDKESLKEAEMPKEDNKIVTRNKDKAKKGAEGEKETVDKKKTPKGRNKDKVDNSKDSANTDTDKAGAETVVFEEPKKEEVKPNLRTRSAKQDGDNTESKTLRKRTVKSTPDSAKLKVRKTDKGDKGEKSEPVVSVENVEDSAVKLGSGLNTSGTDSDEKVTRSKVKTLKGASEIKKCSVNLGEKYNEMNVRVKKFKQAKSVTRNLKSDEPKTELENVEAGMSNKADKAETGKIDTPGIFEKMMKGDWEMEKQKDADIKDSFGFDLLGEEKGEEKMDTSADKPVEKLAEMNENIKQDHAQDEKIQQAMIIENKDEVIDIKETDRKEDIKTIKDKITECHNTVVSITSGTDRKVTMKFKLGPDFHKAANEYVSAPKKRKFDFHAVENITEKNDRKGNSNMPEKLSEKKDETNQPLNTKIEIIDTESKNACYESVKDLSSLQAELEPPISESGEAKTNVEMLTADYPIQTEVQEPKKNEKTGKKHSVENEFQRLVNEAMEEVKNAQKEGETKKQERHVSLRRRQNENVKYNVDDSDNELEAALMGQTIPRIPKGSVAAAKLPKSVTKGAVAMSVSGNKVTGQKGFGLDLVGSSKEDKSKKDVDVYDFTDTEMSDHEESQPLKMSSFKPKYVSNLNKTPINPKKLPFVSTPLSPSKKDEVDNGGDSADKELSQDSVESLPNKESTDMETGDELSYVGKAVEPLKLKLTLVKPMKEKKHKHKKKKKKRDRSREDRDSDRDEDDENSRGDLFENKGKEGEHVELSLESNSGIGGSSVTEISVFNAAELVGDKTGENEEGVMSRNETDGGSVKSSGGADTNSNEGDEDCGTEVGCVKAGRKSNGLKAKEKKHICGYCNVGFSQKCDLRRHVMIHTGERPFPCEICDKKFQRKTDLVKHMRTHTGEKPFQCEYCEKRVSDKSQLSVHRRLHTGDRPYQCLKCEKRFITSTELSRHKSSHCTEKILTCEDCKKTFTMEDCLNLHVKLHFRASAKPFMCEKCVIGFDKRSDYETHVCVDLALNIYVCSECHEEFGEEGAYAEHIKIHTVDVLACNMCMETFPDKHSLETHLCSIGQGSAGKQEQLACQVCGMEFTDQGALFLHSALHDEDVGHFVCDQCPETFNVRKHFHDHQKRRHGDSSSSIFSPPWRDQKQADFQSLLTKPKGFETINSTDLNPSDSISDSSHMNLTQFQNLAQSKRFIEREDMLLNDIVFGRNLQTNPGSSRSENVTVDSGSRFNVTDIKQEAPDGLSPDTSFPGTMTMSQSTTSQSMSFPVNYSNVPVKTESNLEPGGPKPRASVISGMFKIADDNAHGRDNIGNLQMRGKAANGPSGADRSGKKEDSYKYTKSGKTANPMSSDKLFDGNDFVNSPDFSSLTEDDNIIQFKSLIDPKEPSAMQSHKSGPESAQSLDNMNKQYSSVTTHSSTLSGISQKSLSSSSRKSPGLGNTTNFSNQDQQRFQSGSVLSQTMFSAITSESPILRQLAHSQSFPIDVQANATSASSNKGSTGLPLSQADYLNTLLGKPSYSQEPKSSILQHMMANDLGSKTRNLQGNDDQSLSENRKSNQNDSQYRQSQNSSISSFQRNMKSNKPQSMGEKTDSQLYNMQPTYKGMPPSGQRSQFTGNKEFSLLAQTIMGTNYSPNTLAASGRASNSRHQPAGQEGNKRPSVLGNYLTAHEELPASFYFNMDEQMKTGLTSDKNLDDSLLSNFD